MKKKLRQLVLNQYEVGLAEVIAEYLKDRLPPDATDFGLTIGEDYGSYELSLEYQSPETPAEQLEREANEATRKEWERREYERLKRLYGV